MEKIAIVGGGLVGGLLSVYLAKRGYEIHVFDWRPDIRKMKIVQGKSINLALSDRGWLGLKMAGIAEQISPVALPMYGRLMHDTKGELTYQPYGKENQAIYSVSRGLLNQSLIHCAADFERVHFHFEHRCTDFNLDDNTLVFQTPDGQNTIGPFARILGTDGAFSAIRNRMMRLDRFEYSQRYLSHGYKELEIPPMPDGSHQLRKDCLHIWPRGEFMMIALPNPDGSFTCTLFMGYDTTPGFNNIQSNEEIISFFSRYFPDIMPLMPELVDDFNNHPTSSLVMVQCAPWHYRDQALILGDAAHAIVPFYGQGMNCGFEDCRVLNELLDQYNDDWDVVMKEFFRIRKPAADAILELALRNYIEMRDKTADPSFLLQKKIEAAFSAKHPDLWNPLYSQVTFSHIPYNEALDNGNRQEDIMKGIMAMPEIESKWNSPEIEKIILDKIKS
jgi:kynurenine 3-monooxygenase